MSKKIASGAKKLVIDVKVGNGALIKNIEDATKLADLMIKIGKKNGIKVVCLLTNMNVPLGNNIGNALEVEEAISILKDKKQGNLTDLCIELSSHMVSLGLDISYDKSKKMVIENINNGSAYNKFLEFVEAQGGDITKLPLSKNEYKIKSPKQGYLNNIDALELGKLSMHLGAGRESLDDEIDYGSGIIISKNIGDYIKKNDILMTLYTNKNLKASIMNMPIFEIDSVKKEEEKLVYDIIK